MNSFIHPIRHISSTSVSPPPAPPSISRLWSANVTGSSFCVYWSSQATRQIYHVVVEKGPEVLRVWETPESMMAVVGLHPGVLYTVTVTPRACGRQGRPVHVAVRTGESHVFTAKRTFSTMTRSCFTHTQATAWSTLRGVDCVSLRRRCDSQRHSSPHQHPVHR